MLWKEDGRERAAQIRSAARPPVLCDSDRRGWIGTSTMAIAQGCCLSALKAHACTLQGGILWMGAMPAATHMAMAETRSMGLRQQLSRGTLLEWTVSRQGEDDPSAAEGHQVHRDRNIRILIQLQPSILGRRHRPGLELTASARGAANTGQPMEGKDPLCWDVLFGLRAWAATTALSLQWRWGHRCNSVHRFTL